MKKFVSANIVVVARDLSPSTFSSLWLVEEEIVKKEDFVEEPVCTPVATCVVTSNFRLDVFQSRLQIAFTDESLDCPELVINSLSDIVHKLKHMPYIAIGANIVWNIAPDDPDEFSDFVRSLFDKPDLPLYAAFSIDDARFGAYMSKDFLGTRMKVDVKPIKEKGEGEQAEFLRFSFNYHLDLEHGKHIEQMEKFLQDWSVMRNESEKVVLAAINSAG